MRELENVATGHSGVTIAPALAKFVTQEIVHGTEVSRLKAFRPARFSAHQADAHRSIEEVFGEASDVFIA